MMSFAQNRRKYSRWMRREDTSRTFKVKYMQQVLLHITVSMPTSALKFHVGYMKSESHFTTMPTVVTLLFFAFKLWMNKADLFNRTRAACFGFSRAKTNSAWAPWKRMSELEGGICWAGFSDADLSKWYNFDAPLRLNANCKHEKDLTATLQKVPNRRERTHRCIATCTYKHAKRERSSPYRW